jgi:glycosyltransferase involved in cell wall biosynthesis
MVKVLWVTPYPPDHAGGGGQIRQAHLLDALAAEADIELICPAPVIDPAVRASAKVVEVPAPAPPWRDRLRWLRRAADATAPLLSPQPIEVRAMRPVRAAIRPALHEALVGFRPDLVLVEYAGLAPLHPAAAGVARPGHRRRAPGRWVWTLHNLPSRMSAQRAGLMPHRRQRWLLAADARVGARFERRAAGWFDAVITCTDDDATALGAGPKVLVVPNGTDLDGIRPSPVPTGARLVFTGALDTVPNVDAATWFCRQVLPAVRAAEPTVTLDLVGRRPAAEVRALAQPDVVMVHPDVASVAPYLQAARVVVAPLRVGSGSRLKALEALAAGRPLVATTVALEGLGLRPGVHAVVADDAASLASAVIRLVHDDDQARRLATAGRAEVERRFGWGPIGARFAQEVLAVTASSPRGRRR